MPRVVPPRFPRPREDDRCYLHTSPGGEYFPRPGAHGYWRPGGGWTDDITEAAQFSCEIALSTVDDLHDAHTRAIPVDPQGRLPFDLPVATKKRRKR